MKNRAVVITLSAVLFVAFAMLFAGCGGSDSNNNQVTNPPTNTEPFESGTLTTGMEFVHVFSTAGSFNYRCRIHGMPSTITVAANGADSALIKIADNAFPAPAAGSLPIRPTGYVHWVNFGSNPHTVTRP